MTARMGLVARGKAHEELVVQVLEEPCALAARELVEYTGASLKKLGSKVAGERHRHSCY